MGSSFFLLSSPTFFLFLFFLARLLGGFGRTCGLFPFLLLSLSRHYCCAFPSFTCTARAKFRVEGFSFFPLFFSPVFFREFQADQNHFLNRLPTPLSPRLTRHRPPQPSLSLPPPPSTPLSPPQGTLHSFHLFARTS